MGKAKRFTSLRKVVKAADVEKLAEIDRHFDAVQLKHHPGSGSVDLDRPFFVGSEDDEVEEP